MKKPTPSVRIAGPTTKKELVDYVVDQYCNNENCSLIEILRGIWVVSMNRKDLIEAYDEILRNTIGDHLVKLDSKFLMVDEHLTEKEDDKIFYSGYVDNILYLINSEAINPRYEKFYVRVSESKERLDFVVGGGKATIPYHPYLGVIIGRVKNADCYTNS